MLVFGRALMSRPRLLLLDEPTLGIAPMLAREILDTLRSLQQRGLSALLVEQNVSAALRIADRGYVLKDGKVAMQGTKAELLANKDMSASFLGDTVKR